MATELQSHSSATAGSRYGGAQGSLRFRRVHSAESKQNSPEFKPSTAEEDAGREEPKEFRNLPMPMTLKRAAWQIQKMQVPVVSSWQSWKRSKAKSLSRAQENIGGFLSLFALWRKSLHKIGGNFGGGVQSYFLFLRFLVVLNFLSFLLIAGFVLTPSIWFRSAGASPVNTSVPVNCTVYNPTPDGPVVFYQYFLDLLSGTGFMEYSYLFYGYYKDTIMEGGDVYNIPLAYLLTAIFYFAFCLICIIARMGSAARIAVATGGGATGSYSRIVFIGWDYGCLGDRAAKLKQKNIHYQLQMELEEERMKKRMASLTLCQKVVLYSLRVFLSLVAFGLIGAALYGIFLATDFSQSKSNEDGILGLIFEYLPSMVITAGNFVVPFLCDQIALLERYNPSTTIIVALLRSVFLRLVSLGVLLFTLWSQITCNGDTSAEKCLTCQYNHGEYQCWETRVGQEMYKLALFDFLIIIAVLFLVEFPRRIVVDRSSSKLARWVGRQEFLVPANVLGLVYGQTVVWTGALFCPVLPLINTVKFFLLFYCKKMTLFTNCRPATKTFRSTTSTVYFLLVLLFGWSLALVVMIYSLAKIHPSMGCGPFSWSSTMWAIVPASFYRLSPATREFLFYIGSQAFSIPLFIFFCIVMCYFIALASVYGKSVQLLRAQLKLEARDKQFLVKQIEQLSRTLQVPTGHDM